MKSVNPQNALKRVKQELAHHDFLEIKLLTFKKDRAVVIQKNFAKITIVEDGFARQTFSDLDEHVALKILKKLLTKEFPRSHTIYFQLKTSRD